MLGVEMRWQRAAQVRYPQGSWLALQLNPQRKCRVTNEGHVVQPYNPQAKNNFGDNPANLVYIADTIIDGERLTLWAQISPDGPFHLIFIPNVEEQRPQVFEGRDIYKALTAVRDYSHNPRLLILMNSLGGLASVNNTHYQGIYCHHDQIPPDMADRKPRTTIAGTRILTLGDTDSGIYPYPVRGIVLDGEDKRTLSALSDAWLKLVQEENILHRPTITHSGLYLFPLSRRVFETWEETFFECCYGDTKVFTPETYLREYTFRDLFQIGRQQSLSEDEFETLYQEWFARVSSSPLNNPASPLAALPMRLPIYNRRPGFSGKPGLAGAILTTSAYSPLTLAGLARINYPMAAAFNRLSLLTPISRRGPPRSDQRDNASPGTSSPLTDTIRRISRGLDYTRHDYLHWDRACILTIRSNKAVDSLEYHLKNQTGTLYQHTQVEVLSIPALYRVGNTLVAQTPENEAGLLSQVQRGEAIRVATANFDSPLWYIEQFIKGTIGKAVQPHERVLIILDIGSGSRLYPLVGTLVGKGEVRIPHAWDGHLLELTDQVYIQSHMLLEDLPAGEGAFVILGNDQFWALGKNSPITKGLFVLGHDYAMDRVRQELEGFNWIAANTADTVKVLDNQGQAVTEEASQNKLMNERIASFLKNEAQKSQAPYFYQLTQLGHFIEDPNEVGRAQDMVEKPKTWQEIKGFFAKAPLANWWNHGYTYEGAVKAVELANRYGIIGTNADFSQNVLEAIVRQRREFERWQEQRGRSYRRMSCLEEHDGQDNYTLKIVFDPEYMQRLTTSADAAERLAATLNEAGTYLPYMVKDMLNGQEAFASYYQPDILLVDSDNPVEELFALNFSNPLVRTAIQAYRQRFLDRLQKSRKSARSITISFYQANYSQARREFDFSQDLREAVNEIQLVHGTHFIDIGTVISFVKSCGQNLPDQGTNIVIRALLELSPGVKVFASPDTELAIARGQLVIDDGAWVFGGAIHSGRISKGSLVIDSYIGQLTTAPGETLTYMVREPRGEVEVADGEVVADQVSLTSQGGAEIQRTRYRISADAQTGAYADIGIKRSNQPNRLGIREAYDGLRNPYAGFHEMLDRYNAPHEIISLYRDANEIERLAIENELRRLLIDTSYNVRGGSRHVLGRAFWGAPVDDLLSRRKGDVILLIYQVETSLHRRAILWEILDSALMETPASATHSTARWVLEQIAQQERASSAVSAERPLVERLAGELAKLKTINVAGLEWGLIQNRNAFIFVLHNRTVMAGIESYVVSQISYLLEYNSLRIHVVFIANGEDRAVLAASEGVLGRGEIYYHPAENLDALEKEMEKIIAAEKIEQVVAHNPAVRDLVARAFVVAERHNIPTVAFYHGGDAPIIMKQFKAPLTDPWRIPRDNFLKATTMAVVSESGKRAMQALGVDRVMVVGPLIDKNTFNPALSREQAQQALGVEQQLGGRFVMLYPSRISYEKGPLEAIEALYHLKQAGHTKVSLVLVGSAEEKFLQEDIYPAIKRLGLEAEVMVCPAAPLERIAQWMRAADVVILPSRGEGWPLVVAEAGLSARPVVTSQAGGLAEAVIDGQTGYLVEFILDRGQRTREEVREINARAFAQGIIRLIELSASARQAMGEAGRKFILDNFDPDKLIRRHEELLLSHPLEERDNYRFQVNIAGLSASGKTAVARKVA
jgi:glycosyltransferase involved in cell wall biosynthesis